MKQKYVWFWLIGAGLALPVAAEEAGQEPTLALAYGATPGSKVTYETKVTGDLKLEIGGQVMRSPLQATLEYSETVRSADEKSLQLHCAVHGQGRTGEKEIPLSLPPWSVKMKRTGQDVRIDSLKKKPLQDVYQLGELLLFIETTRLLAFTEDPLKEGDQWETELKLETENGPIVVEVESRFTGEAEQQGHPCAVIESDFEAEIELEKVEILPKVLARLTGEQSGTLKSHFALDGLGQVVRSEGRIKIELKPEMEGQGGEEAEGEQEAPRPPERISLEFNFVRTLKEVKPGK